MQFEAVIVPVLYQENFHDKAKYYLAGYRNYS
ncbi:hypothetical protein BROSI_A1368 [Candidatus Brocadia sinica JPN1]|uniref:Uncharacterized protein n=1 Tax=Candidatus Brocadia sinica JPN1 TaxID=1197129 RepID=A0ABQ0JW06_9BACT|nr:hypothetical protein BROSI_A1368 [Candidatus Brocadia sinica JPN1]